MPFNRSEKRKRRYPLYLSIYNGRMCHMALGGRTPFQQLQRLRVTECSGPETNIEGPEWAKWSAQQRRTTGRANTEGAAMP